MATDELGSGVDDDVRPMLEGSTKVRRGKRVIDHERYARFMRYLGDGCDVEHGDAWIPDRFPVEHSRPWRNGAAEVFRIGRIDKDDVDAPTAEGDVELGIGAAVESARRDDLV